MKTTPNITADDRRCTSPKVKMTCVNLDPDLTPLLDRRARELGFESRSRLIRHICREFLSGRAA